MHVYVSQGIVTTSCALFLSQQAQTQAHKEAQQKGQKKARNRAQKKPACTSLYMSVMCIGH